MFFAFSHSSKSYIEEWYFDMNGKTKRKHKQNYKVGNLLYIFWGIVIRLLICDVLSYALRSTDIILDHYYYSKNTRSCKIIESKNNWCAFYQNFKIYVFSSSVHLLQLIKIVFLSGSFWISWKTKQMQCMYKVIIKRILKFNLFIFD